MQVIQGEIHINLEQYAGAIGKKEIAIKVGVTRRSLLYKQIQSTYRRTERGREVWYKLDSLHPEHQKLVKAYLGLGSEEMAADEKPDLYICLDQDIEGAAVQHLGRIDGTRLARLVAWLKALCPEAKHNKVFKQNWTWYHEDYLREQAEGLIYGERITNQQVWVRRVQQLEAEGWQALVSGKQGNQNPRKINGAVQRALMVLALNDFERLPTIPQVLRRYELFRKGALDMLNQSTGEVVTGLGYPKVSESSLWRYLRDNRRNRLTLEQHYSSALEFRSKHEPFVHRKAPSYSLSKLTMDDKVLRFSFENGLTFWTYLVFDVYSGALLGFASIEVEKQAHNITKGLPSNQVDTKTLRLLKNAVLDTFARLSSLGLGHLVPQEIESEQHLASALKEDLLKPGEVFPHVHFCRGGNPQEKKAENFIRRFKYGVEAEYEGFKARPFLKLLQNRLNTDKKPRVYSIAEGQAMLEEMVERYNALPHHQYKRKTKWQVFEEGLRPDKLAPLNQAKLARWVGYQAATSRIHRNQYVYANEETYLLPKASEWFDKLQGREVQVYTLPYLPERAWLWQGEQFVCELQLLSEDMRVESAQAEAQAEVQAAAFAIYEAQRGSLHKIIKEHKDELADFKPWNLPEEEEEVGEVVPTKRSSKLFSGK